VIRRCATLLATLACVAAVGCGDDGGSSTSAPKPALTVSAASSLKGAFGTYADQFDAAKVRFSFAGSDELAAQIRKGVRPDVFAAANTKLPDALYSEGLVRKPVVFAGNRLALAVPSGSAIKSLGDLVRPGTKLVVGSEGVPVGDYTRQVLARLPAAQSKAILANVRSQEPDVKGVVGKLTRGAADAGFVYTTDVRAANGKLWTIELPKALEPNVEYGIAVVKGANEPAAAAAFIDGLLSRKGLATMKASGFEPPPSR
jgi:molybdate transport system substrate-binding protein